VILTAGGGAFGHKGGPKHCAISRAHGEESWQLWEAGTYGDESLTDGVIEYAKRTSPDGAVECAHSHEELEGAFLPSPGAVRQGHAAASSQSAGGRGLP
jgi:hypothetical protein